MSQNSLIKVNITQNSLDFVLKPLDEQGSLFKHGYLKRILNPIKENPEDIRTCTIQCLVQGYS